MNGLMKNNYYAACSNSKVFAGVMFLAGVFVAAVDNTVTTLLTGYILLSMVGFSISAVVSLRKENASKWGKYKLTAPVRRADIIKSYFISQILWLLVGMIFAVVIVSLSVALHGFPFDRNTDIFMLFSAGISVSLLTGALFFPFSYLGSEEKNEAAVIISLLCGIGIVMGMISFLNRVFGPNQTVEQQLAGMILMFCCAAVGYGLSCPLTVQIFLKKEY